ncbi:MAG: sigma 54-interacting transcriptional regulator [Thermodesulfobacteriota bacterium]
MEEKRLLPEDREFFALVKRAGHANPFSDEREALDAEIARTAPAAGKAQRIEKAISAVQERMDAIAKKAPLDVQEYEPGDRNLLELGLWFLLFYQYRTTIDRMIREQMNADKKPGLLQPSPEKAPFASEALAFLSARGVPQEQARRYFELCYQFRRAYFFIKDALVGESPCMRKLRYDLWCNVFTQDLDLYGQYLCNRMEEFSSLFLGETGTGKGAAAAAVGRSGYIPFDAKKGRFIESFSKLFLAVNLSQFPETLIESELFGHRKGAFTGAMENYDGVLSRCSPHGAILLDEIGELSEQLQIKLLQVFQERVYFPVGSHKAESFRGRIIAATNRPLDALRHQGRFRDDFYYRLCSDVIVVPPLRQRLREDPGELGVLVGFLVKRMLGQPSAEITAMVLRVIGERLGADYPWYGNVRELEQCVRRVLLRNTYDGQIERAPGDLGDFLMGLMRTGDIDAHRLLGGYCKLLHLRYGTYEEVARRTGLDRRTVAKYVREWDAGVDDGPAGEGEPA